MSPRSLPVQPPGVSGNAAKRDYMAEARYAFALARMCYLSREGTWFAVDLELTRDGNHYITEVGMAKWSPAGSHEDVVHLGIPENVARDEAPYMRPVPFLFGVTRAVSLVTALEAVRAAAAEAANAGPLYIVCHAKQTERNHLVDIHGVLPGPRNDSVETLGKASVVWFDTQYLFAGLTGTRSPESLPISLLDLVTTLGVPHSAQGWHNAGNDAKELQQLKEITSIRRTRLLSEVTIEVAIAVQSNPRPAALGGAMLGPMSAVDFNRLLGILSRTLIPVELIAHVISIGVEDGVLAPWQLLGLNSYWRNYIFENPELWSQQLVDSLVERLVKLWDSRPQPPPERLVRALRAYTLAAVGRCPAQDDLDWAMHSLFRIENALAWPDATREAGVEACDFHALSYHPLCHARRMAEEQDKILAAAFPALPDTSSSPFASRGLAAWSARERQGRITRTAVNFHGYDLLEHGAHILGETLRMLVRTDAPDDARAIFLAHKWMNLGRCPAVRAWVIRFAIHPRRENLDLQMLHRALT
ncbi:hypothetical protein AURDEDRAFT_132018, partial [Auricularia subglabra TFB-10046 SS5]